jgi:ATP-dependent RNA helicase DDX54/DBP10
MNLDLKSIQYVVFDEADRLFEMGFETALAEIIHRLPPTRQTLLFSATLPKTLVEFAKAGLQTPRLVRLDAEGKISTDLKMAFFSVKQAEKDACLLYLLRDVIGVPTGSNQPEVPEGKGKKKAISQYAAPHQTLVFVATKHHVEYLTVLLTTAGYSVSQIYGTLDQTARSIQMDQFRRGITNILVVTDVAARGIDIPVLENVVNYDFPTGARVFVHRVGRTARAGRTGWAWSFLTTPEIPYLLDLQLFLGRPLKHHASLEDARAWCDSLVLGPFPRDAIDQELESLKSLDAEDTSIQSLREIMRKGHGMYERSKGKASQASYKRAKEMTKDPTSYGLVSTSTPTHPVLFHKSTKAVSQAKVVEDQVEEEKRTALFKVINSFTPAETVFEVAHKSHKGKGIETTAALMKERRRALKKAVDRAVLASVSKAEPEEDDEEGPSGRVIAMADEDDIAVRRDEPFRHLTCSTNGFVGGLRCSIFKRRQERESRLQGLGVLYVLCPEGRRHREMVGWYHTMYCGCI